MKCRDCDSDLVWAGSMQDGRLECQNCVVDAHLAVVPPAAGHAVYDLGPWPVAHDGDTPYDLQTEVLTEQIT